MSFEIDLRGHLIATGSPVRTIVSTRVYPVVLPQNPTYPCITYSGVSLIEMRDLGGPSGRERPRVSINSWALTYTDAQQLAAAVKSRLSGFKGMMGQTDVGSVVLDNSLDEFEEGAGPDGRGVYRVIQDYIVSHTNT